MANEMPEKPPDEDFEAARDWVHRTLPCDELAAQRVLRYLLAGHDAKPAPVAVPEEVLQAAREVTAKPETYYPVSCVFARFILSLVPEPVVEWREGVAAIRGGM